MKTAFACIILCIAALLFGKHQQSRIADLKQRIATVDAPVRMESRRIAETETSGYRSKYRHRETTMSAPEVFETILSLVQSRGVTNGPGVVMHNREAFQAMLKLNLAGQKELIRLIATSDDPRLGEGRDALRKVEQINVCICAMADRHPETALEYLRNSDDLIGKFFRNWGGTDAMIHYAIRRLCERDPMQGLNELVAEARRDGEPMCASQTAKILAGVAEHEPELALETIPLLPDELRPEALRSVLSKAVTDDERTRYFQTVRNGLRGDRESLEMAFRTLLHSNRNVRDQAEPRSWKDRAKWLEGLNLTDDEKMAYAPCEYGDNVADSPDVARWVADFMPPSKERDFLLWMKTQGFWMATDSEAAKAFLHQHFINAEEMQQLADEGFLRPN